jgi:hypothetical protein
MKIALEPCTHGGVTLTGLPGLVRGVAVSGAGGFCGGPGRVAA